jgi:hypothetical protein
MLLALLLVVLLLPYQAEGRACQVRNYAGRPVNFYWMDVTNWGNYISQTKVPLPHATSAPLKTYETHRFFAAFEDEANEVPSWDPDSIPLNAQFVHRGFDQVVTALLNEEGQLYLDDWDIHEGEMARLAQAISICNETSISAVGEDAHAACVLAQAGVLVQSLERERDNIEGLVARMETRLAGAFCTGTGRFQTPAKRTFEWEGHQVDVLADTANLTVFHFPAFLDASATETLLLSAPANGTRHVDIRPNPSLSFDASLAARQDWVQGFVNAQLGGGGGREGGKEEEEALHIFRYNQKEFHSPPCDGLCQGLPLHPSEYAATLLLYPQHPNQKTKDMTAWSFTTEEGTQIGFTSQGNDAVLFLYKNQEVGYVPALLPQLIPCPGTAEEMFVASQWIRRVGEEGREGDEL